MYSLFGSLCVKSTSLELEILRGPSSKAASIKCDTSHIKDQYLVTISLSCELAEGHGNFLCVMRVWYEICYISRWNTCSIFFTPVCELYPTSLWGSEKSIFHCSRSSSERSAKYLHKLREIWIAHLTATSFMWRMSSLSNDVVRIKQNPSW